MLVTDLDGTLLDSRSRLSDGNRVALERLGAAGVVRVIATGRSLHSAKGVLSTDFPIDFLVFSSGVGVVEWPHEALLTRHDMPIADARAASLALAVRGKDFMVHHGAPDTHCFHFRAAGADNPDFDRRVDRYRAYAQRLDAPWPAAWEDGALALFETRRVSQLLVVEPAGGSEYDAIRAELDTLHVVRTTSPLDHASTWIEIFPPHVAKSLTSDWLRQRLGIAHADVLAVGNDHNDRDLLEWAPRSFVVANGVMDLRVRHTVVASNDDDGFAEVAAAALAPES